MPDVVMIFCRAAIAIEDHSDLLRETAETQHIVQVTVGNLLPSLTLFPLHHVEKPSAIFQAASDFNASIILATPCCLQQACLQPIGLTVYYQS